MQTANRSETGDVEKATGAWDRKEVGQRADNMERAEMGSLVGSGPHATGMRGIPQIVIEHADQIEILAP